MKLTTISLAFLLIVVFILSGCSASTSVVTESTAEPVSVPSVEDQASLLIGLQSVGATADITDTVIQDFFTSEGSIVTVNGVDIQVFEYENNDAMESEASQVAPDGGSVGTSMMMWMDAPHFYKAGHIIVLYIGNDEQILTLLQSVMGAQFAGR